MVYLRFVVCRRVQFYCTPNRSCVCVCSMVDRIVKSDSGFWKRPSPVSRRLPASMHACLHACIALSKHFNHFYRPLFIHAPSRQLDHLNSCTVSDTSPSVHTYTYTHIPFETRHRKLPFFFTIRGSPHYLYCVCVKIKLNDFNAFRNLPSVSLILIASSNASLFFVVVFCLPNGKWFLHRCIRIFPILFLTPSPNPPPPHRAFPNFLFVIRSMSGHVLTTVVLYSIWRYSQIVPHPFWLCVVIQPLFSVVSLPIYYLWLSAYRSLPTTSTAALLGFYLGGNRRLGSRPLLESDSAFFNLHWTFDASWLIVPSIRFLYPISSHSINYNHVFSTACPPSLPISRLSPIARSPADCQLVSNRRIALAISQ